MMTRGIPARGNSVSNHTGGDEAAFLAVFHQWPPAEQAWHWTSDGADSEPTLPLVASVRGWTRHGMAWTHRRYQSPIGAQHGRRLLTHVFTASEVLDLSTKEAAARAAAGLAQMRADGDRLDRQWEDTWFPEIRARMSEATAMDPSGAGPADIARLWAQLDEIGRRLWAIHFDIVMPAHLALRELDELVRQHFGDDPVHSARALTAGETSWTTRTAAALDDLVAQARAGGPGLAQAMAAADPDAALAATEVGRAFQEAVAAFVAEYGKKLAGGLTDPSWIEDATPVLAMVRAAAAGLLPVDRGAILAERDRVEAEVLAGQPPAVRGALAAGIRRGRHAARLLEDHNFWLDQQIPYAARRLALLTGQRLHALGLVADREDIWYLDIPALVGMGDGSDLAAQVSWARDATAAGASRVPPRELGGPAPVLPPHPMTDQGASIPTPDDTGALVAGQPGSRGVVVGPVRVVRTLADAPTLQPGEILVTASTSPSWVPWYRLAGAVVTDQGGPLAHAAIVAREMGIPAVVGTRTATTRLKTGMMVEVDGTRGRVRLVDAGVDAG